MFALLSRQYRSPELSMPGDPCCCCLMLLSSCILLERLVMAAVKSYETRGLCIDMVTLDIERTSVQILNVKQI